MDNFFLYFGYGSFLATCVILITKIFQYFIKINQFMEHTKYHLKSTDDEVKRKYWELSEKIGQLNKKYDKTI